METTQEKINRFRLYNRTMIAAALAKPNRRYQGVPAKLLLCSILDSLSVAAFPDTNMKNGERFRETIKCFSEFEYIDHVSLLQLLAILDSFKSVPIEFQDFHKCVQGMHLERFPKTQRLFKQNISIDRDPTLKEILEIWPKDINGEPIKKGGLNPLVFTHGNLIWKYRNKLAHEFRNPGNGVDIDVKLTKTAYYQEVSKVTDMSPIDGLSFENRWELVYPTGFFYHLTKSILDGVCNSYQKQGNSPFLSYSEGSSWLV
ncbi:hypothetical protein P7M42_07130 [Vibrio parahaemolyticus]|nr:hypothetical protein [Vibrio parahaemolyticus]